MLRPRAVAARLGPLPLALLLACPGDEPTADPSGTSTGTTAAVSTTSTTPDDTTGTTAPPVDTTGPDQLPPAPTLLSPADEATDVPVQSELCWSLVDDPEGEAVRYRVFVDDIELTEGRLGTQDGHEGPCVGPLTFDHEQRFSWHVIAFEADQPERASPPSETWHFTTEYDGISVTVFADDFQDDRGWTLDGDATAGAWVRGDPAPATHLGLTAQPAQCTGGTRCMFTGQNVGGLPDAADVAGGSTILTSPPFDLGGAAAATVQLSRFLYKSEPGPDSALRVELLVPDAAAPDGMQAHLLEQLATDTASDPANRWTPREYAACGLPMVDGTRLRITATDTGPGILEAALDSVSVHAHDFTTVCDGGAGGQCDPAAGAAACPDPLWCCPQGTIQAGVYRCEEAVAGLDYARPTASPDDPGNGPLGCNAPDLIIDPSWIEPVLTDIFVSEATCELLEGCVGGVGWRTILRFSLVVPNIGARDLVLGVAANEPDVFHYSECHGHYHFDAFASYELRDAGGVVATGHKQAFCLLDSFSWAWPSVNGVYDCSNQGISRGHADIYESDLPCQWVDVTDLPPGDYTLRASLNQPRPDHALPLLIERDYDNDTIEVPVTLP